MTRRTLLVPLFVAAFILAPASLASAAPRPAIRAGSSAEAGRTGLYRWSVPIHCEALGPQGWSA